MKIVGDCNDEDVIRMMDEKITFIYSQCDCEGWKKYIPILDSHTVMSAMRGATHIPYPEEGVFKFCPWCGNQRHTL